MALSLSATLLPHHPRRSTDFSSSSSAPASPQTHGFFSGQPPPTYSALATNSNNKLPTTCLPKVLSSSSCSSHSKLSHAWRQVHGEYDWAGLLDPMDPLLRSELIRYGEMAQSCYDAFDYDPFSYYFGGCRFPRRAFLDSLHLTRHGYDVTRYLYATANIRLPNFFTKSRANWIGYVAVSDDETSRVLGRRDIAIAWRGTVTRLEWLADLMNYLKPVDGKKIPSRDPRVKVQSGFVDLYTEKDDSCHFCKYSAREQVLTEVKRLTEKYDGAGEEVSITITGHSLGSALATLSAYDIAETGLNLVEGEGSGRPAPICVFSFSGPRVGNVRFKERLDFLGVKVLSRAVTRPVSV
ncbi:unnamed protein product [Linum tenue]|uniref:Fungal lipase-type domain-containing protein n=1 Tax=Linum tenue TaxID=586396 RepID=A0AAV0LJS2_9ROSI|nr:unnamed protein product [Linum tenue]